LQFLCNCINSVILKFVIKNYCTDSLGNFFIISSIRHIVAEYDLKCCVHYFFMLTTGPAYAEPVSISNVQSYIIANFRAFAGAIAEAHACEIFPFFLCLFNCFCPLFLYYLRSYSS